MAGNIDISTAITVLTGTATATQLVTVVDTTAPVITAPVAVIASSGDNLPVAVTLGTATASDLVDAIVNITNDAPATFPVGVTTVTYSAADSAGNISTATQLVTVNLLDVTAPVVTAPIAVTAEATGAATAIILGAASATDIVDGIIITTNDAPIGGFPVGVTTITYSGTDLAGNIGTATQTVTITDTTAPIITAPAGVTADSINGADPVVNIGQATATDLFAVTIINDAPAIFPVGATTVTWTATDVNGNSSAATQLVAINLIDTLPPVITVPANVSVSTNTSQATVDIGIASANDNIDGIVAVTNNAPATFPVGVSTVIYTASDIAGNTATATQQIYVSFSSTVGGGTGGGTTTPPPTGGGATVGIETVYWHHNDHLGTPQAMTDINGTKVWEMSQTPFGIATVNEDPDGDGLLVVNNFRFPGQYYDAETGLNYNYFRTYDPALDRYFQHDPIGLRGGPNPYAYVDGNPVLYSDPSGLVRRGRPGLTSSQTFTNLSAQSLIREIRKYDSSFCFASNPGSSYTQRDVRFLERKLREVSSTSVSTPNRIYSARELIRRAEEFGPFHNFPESFNLQIFRQGNRRVISKSYVQYELKGILNGRTGTSEIGVRPSVSGQTEVITHRFFRSDF